PPPPAAQPPPPDATPPPPAATPQVEGKALEEIPPPLPPASPDGLPLRALPAAAAALALFALGWFRQARRSP
ncbi:MAG: hypothetical protein LBC18_05465, partial [Opitutaceae bacterium]|nr:hypothetical protein [Opitutaceae bacterium]